MIRDHLPPASSLERFTGAPGGSSFARFATLNDNAFFSSGVRKPKRPDRDDDLARFLEPRGRPRFLAAAESLSWSSSIPPFGWSRDSKSNMLPAVKCCCCGGGDTRTLTPPWPSVLLLPTPESFQQRLLASAITSSGLSPILTGGRPRGLGDFLVRFGESSSSEDEVGSSSVERISGRSSGS